MTLVFFIVYYRVFWAFFWCWLSHSRIFRSYGGHHYIVEIFRYGVKHYLFNQSISYGGFIIDGDALQSTGLSSGHMRFINRRLFIVLNLLWQWASSFFGLTRRTATSTRTLRQAKAFEDSFSRESQRNNFKRIFIYLRIGVCNVVYIVLIILTLIEILKFNWLWQILFAKILTFLANLIFLKCPFHVTYWPDIVFSTNSMWPIEILRCGVIQRQTIL